MSFSDNKIVLIDPKTKKKVTTEIDSETTAGRLDCTLKDTTKCSLDNVKMLDNGTGDFAADMQLPSNLKDDIDDFKQKLISMKYAGRNWVTDDFDLKDLFDKEDDDSKTDEWLFPDGDDGKYIDEEDGEQFVMPWEFLSPGARMLYDNETEYKIMNNITESHNSTLSLRRMRRRMQDTLDQSTSRYISNPIICKTAGAAILWEGLSADKYPIYEKDSLLNTNDEFDYGEFNDLPNQLAANPKLSSFVFTFTQTGTYVFTDSRNPVKQMIIAILDVNQGCPGDSPYAPLTYSALLKVRAQMRDVLEPPDWYMFFGVLAAGCLLILLTVFIIGYIVKRDWRQKKLPRVKYQEFNYTSVERSDVQDKRAIVSINAEAESFTIRHMGREDDDDEDFDE